MKVFFLEKGSMEAEAKMGLIMTYASVLYSSSTYVKITSYTIPY